MKYHQPMLLMLLTALLLVSLTGEVLAQSTRRWVAPQGVVDVLRNGNNYTSRLGHSFFDFNKGGAKLDAALDSRRASAVAVYGYRAVTRTNVPDGENNECPAFSRGCTGAPGTWSWRRGRPVIYSTGVIGGVTPGTLIATFMADASAPGGYRYSGHTGLFAGYTSERGISLWDQNWLKDRTILWHHLSPTDRGGLSDAKAYYVVETVSQ